MRIIKSLVLLVCFSFIVIAQETSQKKPQGYEISNKYVAVYLVSDKLSPIELLEPTKVIGYENKNFDYLFNIKNTSSKSITEFEINSTNWFGSNGFRETYKFNQSRLFIPFQTISLLDEKLDEDNTFSFKSVDEVNIQRLGLSDKPPNIYILMVTKVTFEDGTIYDASSKFKEIEKYIDKIDINSKMSFEEINRQVKKLHKFIKKLMNSD